ncbi:cupin-like domain-containing protein [Mycetohabitans endofungorum]|uniref:cupin-like domain-containing protein n=1 Tax=Mycetohabitans endofungorum TaxID=417203 RepID=UPI002B05D5EC|nr:cupin-like domain-containing protein [Mycetohabitans endofungorum]
MTDFFEKNQPAIITNALTEWHIEKLWSPQYLISTLKDKVLAVNISKNGKFDYTPAHEFKNSTKYDKKIMTFGDAGRKIIEGDENQCLYIMQKSIPEEFPEIMNNIIIPKLIIPHNPIINLWFGKNTITPLHFDMANNFFAQLNGNKKFTIFSPHDTCNLYPYHHDLAFSHISHVDASNPNLLQYPNFSKARAYKFTLNFGELLFLPAYWWHHVNAIGTSISVSFWWPQEISQFLECPNSMLTLNNLYKEDKFSSFKEKTLKKNNLDFCKFSKILLKNKKKWAASIFALTALDEYINSAYSQHNAFRKSERSLSNLQNDLRSACSAILTDKTLSSQCRRTLEMAPSLASHAPYIDDSRIAGKDVQALLDTITTLSQR